jgi:hypothetical protein
MKVGVALHKMWVLSEVVDATAHQLLHLFQLSACKAYEGFIKQWPQPLDRLHLWREWW